MDVQTLATISQDLSSIEHAMLLSLMAKQHCILETAIEALNQLTVEVEAVSSDPAASSLSFYS